MPNTVSHNEKLPLITESEKLYSRLIDLIPAGTQTLAKGMTQYVKGVAPAFLTKGKGARVWDADGNEYIDYTMGVGPLSLGYCYPRVDEAIRQQLNDGITFSLIHPLELEIAELITQVVPNAEMVRYSKTGADVTSAAVRLARAFTGKNTVLCCGYHGWHDWYIATTDRSRGIPPATFETTYTFNYNDIPSVLAAIDNDTAAIILEPTVFEAPRDNFLQQLREICTERGIILIFDEMWTGFRLALGGAQEYFGVQADLACFSKAVANGMPVAILTGRRDIMQLLDKDVFFFTTFGGEALSLAAIKVTIEEIREKNVPAHLRHIGEILQNGYNALAAELEIPFTRCIGLPCRTMVTFDASAGNPLLLKSFVQQELLRHGILWTGFHNVSFSHTEDDAHYTLETYRIVLTALKSAVENSTVESSLQGEPVQPVFRKTGHFNTKPRA